QVAESAGLEVQHVDQAHEVHAAMVEAVPAPLVLALAETTEELRAVVADHVVLARHVEHLALAGTRLLHEPLHGGERVLPRQVGEVAGVQYKIRAHRQRVDLGQRRAERGRRVRVRREVEADVRIADLGEAEGGVLRLGARGGAQRARVQHAALHQQQGAGAGPGHALHEVAAAHRAVVVFVLHGFPLHGAWDVRPSPCITGWPNGLFRFFRAGNKVAACAVIPCMPIEAPAASPPPQPATGARFEAQVLPWLDAAWNLARWLARDDADAQDVVQEAMLRALRYFDSFHGGDARVWLLAIVRNTYFTLRSKTLPEHLTESLDEDTHPLVDEQATPEALALLAVDVGSLRAALERLPPPWREAIVLRELE